MEFKGNMKLITNQFDKVEYGFHDEYSQDPRMAQHDSEWNGRSAQSPKHDGRQLLSRSGPAECLLSANDLSRSGVWLRQSSLRREAGHGQHGRCGREMSCRIRREISDACA
ncbi:uncharacterized protein [Blastocystis hominis]|uniref:Uncharacterized protein n=1 Tax=Blastocystis hominis TaxID=12968 RepID=D8M7I6_BLAHO|nr:uncharacterized protein [Blastocystis hominis]CBK24025.2 unnamed protein product [Blastocystis hominis]|eukprot:XP_012898073.1 uncharacterized protein [Blastocystis hominis]